MIKLSKLLLISALLLTLAVASGPIVDTASKDSLLSAEKEEHDPQSVDFII